MDDIDLDTTNERAEEKWGTKSVTTLRVADREEGQRLSPTQVMAQAVLLQAFMDAGVVPEDQFIEAADCVAARAYLTTPSEDLTEVCGAALVPTDSLLGRARHLQSLGWPRIDRAVLKEIYGV